MGQLDDDGVTVMQGGARGALPEMVLDPISVLGQ
jgi:hypothetical protein